MDPKVVDICWHKRFSAEEEPCGRPAKWKHPPVPDGIATGYMRAVRWCDLHRHEGDVPIEEA